MFNKDEVIEQVSVRDQVADIIRKKILSREFTPGQQLIERSVGESLNVSTTPVKEAFRMLHSEGLLYTIPRKGSYVSEFARGNLQQVVFARGALDGTASYFAAKNITDQDLEKLDDLIFQAKRLVEQNDTQGLADINRKLHGIIRKASNNQYLIHLINNMTSIDKTVREIAISRTAEENQRALSEHIAIVEALRNRQSELAEDLTRNHIRRVVLFVVDESLLST